MEQRVTLEDLEAGSLFRFGDTIGFKSEYRTDLGATEAYILGSGEMFWGGIHSPEEQSQLLVEPLPDFATFLSSLPSQRVYSREEVEGFANFCGEKSIYVGDGKWDGDNDDTYTTKYMLDLYFTTSNKDK